MDTVRINNFRAASSSYNFKRVNPRGPNINTKGNSNKRFIKGPISLKWILAASELTGKSLEISMVLWFLKGVTSKNTVKLSGKRI